MARVLVVSTADTDLLAARSVADRLAAVDVEVVTQGLSGAGLPDAAMADAAVALVRLLGGARAWPEGLAELERRGVALVALGGEAGFDAELAARSTLPVAQVARVHEHLRHGGLDNWEAALRFVAGLDAPDPVALPDVGVHGHPTLDPARCTVGIVFYRSHWAAGNTDFVDELSAALEAHGVNALPVFAYSLRGGGGGVVDLLRAHEVDAVITTVLAAGVAGDDGHWVEPALSTLDVPVVHAITSTSSREAWESSSVGLGPLDATLSVALPEFDGRIITVPFSFKEEVALGLFAYRAAPDRCARVAGIAARLARLRHTPAAEKRVAVVLSNYPTKDARIGNGVGLDVPASTVEILRALAGAGYRVDDLPADGDELVHRLVEAGGHDRDTLTDAQLAHSPGRVTAAQARAWHDQLQPEAAAAQSAAWGEPPGEVRRTPTGELGICGLDLGHVFVALQPPRGFGENPIAIYHDPNLVPPHHYLATYRWLDEVWGADAIVHVGKHGTLEWMPGKGLGLSSACWPDAILGDVPLLYPFVINDPGEGTQAKRRAHAVVVDHLIAPMMRAETYDDLARLEGLVEDYDQLRALDPSKLDAVRDQIWEVVQRAEMHRDLGLEARPEGDGFDGMLVHLDGYLCELKDLQVKDGLHVLGLAPQGEQEVGLVMAMLRLPNGDVPPLRGPIDGLTRAQVDAAEARARRLVHALQDSGWDPDSVSESGDAGRALRYAATHIVPALRKTKDEITHLLGGLEGRHVPSGPSGSPTRGMADLLPTGRNFYSVDPKALPTRYAWEVGKRLAEQVIERHRAEEGRPPEQVGLVVWGTSAMRTGGDDVAEVLALLGCRPVWAEEAKRVTGVELVPEAELGRPRVDVVVRISGFFRDAFPGLIDLMDDARRLAFPERADPAIFGSAPGTYGAGILPLIDGRNWDSDHDLAEVYVAWGGYAYGRGISGVPAHEAMRDRLAQLDVAVKNQDNREHDLFDSDDYFQYHGGMIATVRALTGRNPKAYFGDSADPSRPVVRGLDEETRRVVRSRVLNPRWLAGMRRHGYKGAFEMAATVDYLYGYDVTAQVVEDWVYEQVTQRYLLDSENRKFLEDSNPWAFRAMAERLLEAADREVWGEPPPELLDALRKAYLENEAGLEAR